MSQNINRMFGDMTICKYIKTDRHKRNKYPLPRQEHIYIDKLIMNSKHYAKSYSNIQICPIISLIFTLWFSLILYYLTSIITYLKTLAMMNFTLGFFIFCIVLGYFILILDIVYIHIEYGLGNTVICDNIAS